MNRRDFVAVGEAFGVALRRNQVSRAKYLLKDSKWSEFEKWIAEHEPFSCPPASNFEPNGGGTGGGKLLPNNMTATYRYFYFCTTKQYSFTVEEIVLENIENNWTVVDWSGICERFDGKTGGCD